MVSSFAGSEWPAAVSAQSEGRSRCRQRTGRCSTTRRRGRCGVELRHGGVVVARVDVADGLRQLGDPLLLFGLHHRCAGLAQGAAIGCVFWPSGRRSDGSCRGGGQADALDGPSLWRLLPRGCIAVAGWRSLCGGRSLHANVLRWRSGARALWSSGARSRPRLRIVRLDCWKCSAPFSEPMGREGAIRDV